MNKRLAEIKSRRQRLLEKIESQRMEVAAIAERGKNPWRWLIEAWRCCVFYAIIRYWHRAVWQRC